MPGRSPRRDSSAQPLAEKHARRRVPAGQSHADSDDVQHRHHPSILGPEYLSSRGLCYQGSLVSCEPGRHLAAPEMFTLRPPASHLAHQDAGHHIHSYRLSAAKLLLFAANVSQPVSPSHDAPAPCCALDCHHHRCHETIHRVDYNVQFPDRFQYLGSSNSPIHLGPLQQAMHHRSHRDWRPALYQSPDRPHLHDRIP